jgi:molecular chaperone GrpE (heat shock protein)
MPSSVGDILFRRQSSANRLNVASMTDRPLPKLIKWPFFVADAVLLLLAWWIMTKSPHPLAPWPMFFMVASVIAAFGFAVWPYVLEYQAALKLAESGNLTTAVAEIGKLQTIADQIRLATGQWQTVQEHSGKTVGAAKEISERMTAEAKAFAEFMQKANDSEKGHLRLEVEKLHRNEGEWLQIVVRLLDHVFAIYQAAVRSGQSSVREQLALFQNACRDVVRRIGLTPIEATPGELFDETRHQLIDGAAQPPAGAFVGETLATGYSFQGQLLRRSLVRLKAEQAEPPPPEAAAESTAAHADIEPASSDPDWSAEQGFRLEPEPLPDSAGERSHQS